MAQIKATNATRGIDEVLQGNGINGNDVKVFVGARGPKETERFVKLFQKQLEIVRRCKPTTVKIFHYFLCEMQYGNYVEADIKVIALINDVSEISVKRALKELIECGVIIIDKDHNDRRRNTYMISPIYAWKGNPGDRIKSLKRLDQNQLTISFPTNSDPNENGD
ncbi:MAG: hypothetical protein EBS86_13805 [Crocinitomicaceae bacterium]|nr:hypothetical protein [Crocinitomicaceae bacterium]